MGLLMNPRLFIVPRWNGTPQSDFYPWLQARLREAPSFELARAISMPRPERPEVAMWHKTLAGTLDSEPAHQTVLLGHSVGAQAVLRYLAGQAPERRFAGAVLVAGWWSVDAPWDSLLPWMESFDFARARAAAKRFVVLLSDNDPFTADHVANAALWRERLGAEVRRVPGAKHFNGLEEPAVLEAVRGFAIG